MRIETHCLLDATSQQFGHKKDLLKSKSFSQPLSPMELQNPKSCVVKKENVTKMPTNPNLIFITRVGFIYRLFPCPRSNLQKSRNLEDKALAAMIRTYNKQHRKDSHTHF